jgi:hypothetical protein
MRKLIIHIGPPKCGSSTIQTFLKQKPFVEKVKFKTITAKTINSFKEHNTTSESFNKFIKQTKKDLRNYNTVIISHEYLFGHTALIKELCTQTNADDIRIIGYSRKQSKFLISAYAQWEFRSKESFDYYNNILKQNNISPIYFTGLEAFLASVILSDFNSDFSDPRYRLFNWNRYYNEIKEAIPNSKVFAGCLPSQTYSFDLIDDFCKKADLTPKTRKINQSKKKVNIKFDSTLTESVYNALSYGIYSPESKYHNYYMEDLSTKLGRSVKSDDTFIKQLSNYIDYSFTESNKNFCNQYNIPESELRSNKEISKVEIISLINKEIEKRKENPEEIISYYKKMTGEWSNLCLNTQYKTIFRKIAVLYKYI